MSTYSMNTNTLQNLTKDQLIDLVSKQNQINRKIVSTPRKIKKCKTDGAGS